jgi:hypothetical protein
MKSGDAAGHATVPSLLNISPDNFSQVLCRKMEAYRNFIQNWLPRYLEAVPLATKSQMWIWHEEDACENLFQITVVSVVLCLYKPAWWRHCLKESGTSLVNDSIANRRRPRWLLVLRNDIKTLGKTTICCYISLRWHKLVLALDVISENCNSWSLKTNHFMNSLWPNVFTTLTMKTTLTPYSLVHKFWLL